MKEITEVSIVYKNENNEYSQEFVKTICLDDDKQIYQIVEPPLFAQMAVGDIVSVTIENDNQDCQYLCADDIVESSKNSTINVVSLNKKSLFLNDEFKKILDEYNLLYKYFEDELYLTVNIPYEFDYSIIHVILEKLENSNFLSYKESVLYEKHRQDIKEQ